MSINNIFYRKKALSQVFNIDPGEVHQISDTVFTADGREWSVLSMREAHDAAQEVLDKKYQHILATAPHTLEKFDYIKDGRMHDADHKSLNWEREQRRGFGADAGYGSLLNLLDGVEYRETVRRPRCFTFEFNIYERATK